MVGTTGRAIQKSRNFITPPVMLRSKLECTDWNNWPCTILSTIANRTLQLQLAWLPASPLLRTFTPSELHDHFLPPQKILSNTIGANQFTKIHGDQKLEKGKDAWN